MARLFNISEAANIAIHSMTLIAASEKTLNSLQISNMLNFSRNHVAKILQILSRYGLISSKRGPQGGFKLKKPAAEISLYKIMELIDGKMEPEHCRGNIELCPFETCIYGIERQRWFKEFVDYYSSCTINDFVLKTNPNEEKHN